MEFIKYEVNDHICVITLNRPPVNSLSLQLYKEIAEAFASADSDNDVWSVVLTSEGKHFCAGNDISEFNIFGPDYVDQIIKATRAAHSCRKPIITAIKGAIMGAGLAFAACGDIVVAADTAKINIAEINMGLCGTLSEGQKLLPLPLMRYMALTGESVKVAELEKYGIIMKIVPVEELLDTALEIAKTLNSKPPLSVWKTKAALNNIAESSKYIYRTAAFEYEASLQLAKTEDHKEAYTAFLEKRAPEFHCK